MAPNLASVSSAIHLSGAADIAVHSDTSPSWLGIRIKASIPDSFRKGCFVHIGKGSMLCAQSILC